jgi:divalent metal cation (Fe/Co/Zn/Cd) transporter
MPEKKMAAASSSRKVTYAALIGNLLIAVSKFAAPASGILEIAQSESDNRQVNGVVTIHLAPDQVVAALSVKFKDELVVQQVEECNERLERQISEAHPRVTVIITKPRTTQAWEAE